MTDRELLQQALDALDTFDDENGWGEKQKKTYEAIKARLAQPESEPKKLINVNGVLEQAGYVKKKEWVGLTDEEIREGNRESWVTTQAWQSAVWWAEAKLKEKNSE
jgi:hypothetical protein